LKDKDIGIEFTQDVTDNDSFGITIVKEFNIPGD